MGSLSTLSVLFSHTGVYPAVRLDRLDEDLVPGLDGDASGAERLKRPLLAGPVSRKCRMTFSALVFQKTVKKRRLPEVKLSQDASGDNSPPEFGIMFLGSTDCERKRKACRQRSHLCPFECCCWVQGTRLQYIDTIHPCRKV